MDLLEKKKNFYEFNDNFFQLKQNSLEKRASKFWWLSIYVYKLDNVSILKTNVPFGKLLNNLY